MRSFNPHSHHTPGRALKRWLFFLILLGIAGASLYWFFKRQGDDFLVTLTATKGSVEFRKNEKENWTTVDSLPLTLEKSSEIRTLNDSGAEIQMKDNGIIRLDNFTHLVLTSNQGEIDWVQTDGNTHHQLLPNSQRKNYKLALSEGEISAFGTAFEVKNRDSDTTVLELEGTIKINFKDKTVQEVKEGEKITLNPVGRKISELTEDDLKETWTFQNLEKDQKDNLKLADNIIQKAGIVTSFTNENENITDSSNNLNSNENQTVFNSQDDQTANSNSNQSLEIKEKTEIVANTNANSSDKADQTNTNDNNTNKTQTPSSSNDSSTTTSASSGVTTRGQCENSGGHWYSANKTCKCPPSNYFANGKCNKK